jgi:hypothetical protein
VPQKEQAQASALGSLFLKVYLREGPGCSTVGGSKGAIDPKTMWKKVWLFFECIAKLADNVVSYLFRHNLASRCLT